MCDDRLLMDIFQKIYVYQVCFLCSELTEGHSEMITQGGVVYVEGRGDMETVFPVV